MPTRAGGTPHEALELVAKRTTTMRTQAGRQRRNPSWRTSEARVETTAPDSKRRQVKKQPRQTSWLSTHQTHVAQQTACIEPEDHDADDDDDND